MVTKSNIRRIKNILEGNYTEKSDISIGYDKKKVAKVEGDIWEENGKTWTIKNGLKQTISKMDIIRKSVLLPLICPECGHRMKHPLDSKFYKMRNKCFDCVILDDTNKIIAGTYETYEKSVVKNNVSSYIKDLDEVVDEYISTIDSDYYVTENGDIESWSRSHTKEELKDILKVQIDDFKKKIDDIL